MEDHLTIHLDLHFKETQVHLTNSPYTAKKGYTYTVGCQGVAQLRVPAPRFVRGGPAKVGVCNSILLTESSCMIKINEKNNPFMSPVSLIFHILDLEWV